MASSIRMYLNVALVNLCGLPTTFILGCIASEEMQLDRFTNTRQTTLIAKFISLIQELRIYGIWT